MRGDYMPIQEKREKEGKRMERMAEGLRAKDEKSIERKVKMKSGKFGLRLNL